MSATGSRSRWLRLVGPLIFSVAVVFAFNFSIEQWEVRKPQGTHLSGYYQGDMPTYICFARMSQKTPTGMHYASPHDVRENPPAMFVNLPISLIGWLMSAGVSVHRVDLVLRLTFGLLMMLLLAVYLRKVFRPEHFWGAFAVVSVGSGYAWIIAVSRWPTGLSDPVAFWNYAILQNRYTEMSYYWWYLDLFRNLIHSLELIYHTLVFGMMASLATRRFGLALAFLALGCLSHPFVGIQMCGVCSGSLLLLGKRGIKPFVASVFIALTFIGYYLLVLRQDPAIASLQQQHALALSEPLEPGDMLIAYGVALIGPGLLVLRPNMIRVLLREHWPVVPAAVLFFWTLLLTQNSRLPGEHQLMPMHFTRGYLHVSAWILTFVWIQRIWVRRHWKRWSAALVGLLLLIPTLPDGLMYWQGRTEELPQMGHLIWDDRTEDILAWLRVMPPNQHVVVAEEGMGKLVCAFTDHRSAFGTPLTTPHHFERQQQMEQLLINPAESPPLVQWADVVIAQPYLTMRMVQQGWIPGPCNYFFCAVKRGPDAPARVPARNSVPQ